jgi:toxin secretion/phage lysis holin
VKTFWPWLQGAIAVTGGFLGWFLGGADGFLYTLIVFTVIDYITGVMCAVINKDLRSDIGARGIAKKVMVFVLVGVAHMIDSYIIGDNNTLRTAVIFFYLSNEGISLLENASRIGLPIPKKLKDVLSVLHNKSEGKDKDSDAD